MALSNAMVFEVRTVGSNNSGGGFKSGASGLDRSQQDAAFASGTNLTVHATDNTKVDPDVYAVVAADVGNCVNITAGAGWTVGIYEITAQDGTYWTLDRSPAAIGTTGGTWAMGGALATIQKAFDTMTVAGMACWIKATATYSISAVLTTPAGSSSYSTRTIVKGYTTTRGDDGRPVIQTTAGVNGMNLTSDGWCLYNLDFFGNSLGLIGLNSTATYVCEAINCIFRNWTQEGIKSTTTAGFFYRTEVSTCVGTTAAMDIAGGCADTCWSHNNTKPGFTFTSADVKNCIASNNTGATSDGFLQTSYPVKMRQCVAHANGRHGINVSSYPITCEVSNCICTSNGGYGISLVSNSPVRDVGGFHHNAFRANTSGERQNLNAGTGDVTLTADPYTNAAADDYTLNNTSGGGAACRNAGFPGATPWGETGYDDIGVYRHQDPAGGGGLLTHPGMQGGARG